MGGEYSGAFSSAPVLSFPLLQGGRGYPGTPKFRRIFFGTPKLVPPNFGENFLVPPNFRISKSIFACNFIIFIVEITSEWFKNTILAAPAAGCMKKKV